MLEAIKANETHQFLLIRLILGSHKECDTRIEGFLGLFLGNNILHYI